MGLRMYRPFHFFFHSHNCQMKQSNALYFLLLHINYYHTQKRNSFQLHYCNNFLRKDNCILFFFKIKQILLLLILNRSSKLFQQTHQLNPFFNGKNPKGSQLSIAFIYIVLLKDTGGTKLTSLADSLFNAFTPQTKEQKGKKLHKQLFEG